MKLRLGSKLQCTRNSRPEYWWEFKLGGIYTIIERHGRLSIKTENNPLPYPDGREYFINDASVFFGDHPEENDGGSLAFKFVNLCGNREEVE